MALVAGQMVSSFQIQKLTNQTRIGEDEGPPRKRQKTSTEFQFSFDDLERNLYTRDEIKTYTFIDKPASSDKKEICFWCDAISEQDSFKCPYHGDKTSKSQPTELSSKPKLPYAFQSIPDEVRLCKSSIPGAGYGIQANTVIPSGAWIGPYEGTIINVRDAPKKSSYMWEIFQEGRLSAYIDGSDENTSSWMRFIRCARHPAEQNLHAFQYLGKIYYRAYTSLPRGEELLVWYDDKYTQYMGMPFSPMDSMAVTTTDGKLIQLLKNAPTQKTPSPTPGPVTPPATPTKKQHFNGFPVQTNADSQSTHALQMQTSFQKIGALHSSNAVKHLNGFQQIPSFQPVVTTPSNTSVVSPVKPSPQHSNGFVLKISDGSVTSPSDGNKDGNKEIILPPSPSSSGSPLSSPTSPNTKECFKFESQSTAELKSEPRHEFVETSLWRCGQCKKTFAQRAMLQIHICARVPNKPYQCGHCGESFSLPTKLRAHAIIHQGRKPFKCGYCSRSFSGATTLNNHIRTHTGEKPFNCDKCWKTFTQGSQLSRHQKIPGDCVPRS